MHRRELIAGVGSLGVLGTAAYVQFGSDLFRETGDDPEHDPVSVDVIYSADTGIDSIALPDTGRVTFVDLFATTCSVCASQMPDLREAYATFGDEVTFLSVTAEQPTVVDDEVVLDWWDEHEGTWPVARDLDWSFTRHYRQATPTAVLFDSAGRIRWEHTGRKTTDDVVNRIRDIQ